MNHQSCQCREITGVKCHRSAEITIETMPVQWRDSHEKCGNRGVYPLNGAIRLRVSRECAAELIDGDWTFEVRA